MFKAVNKVVNKEKKVVIELFQDVQSNDYGQIACFFGFVFMTVLTAVFALAKKWKTVIASFLMGASAAIGSVAFQDRASYYALPNEWRNAIVEMKNYAQNNAPEQIEKFQEIVQKNVMSLLSEKEVKVVRANLPESCRSYVKN